METNGPMGIRGIRESDQHEGGKDLDDAGVPVELGFQIHQQVVSFLGSGELSILGLDSGEGQN